MRTTPLQSGVSLSIELVRDISVGMRITLFQCGASLWIVQMGVLRVIFSLGRQHVKIGSRDFGIKFCRIASGKMSSGHVISQKQHSEMRGLVLGVYSMNDNENNLQYTLRSKTFDTKNSGKLTEAIQSCTGFTKEIKQRIFYNLSEEFPVVAVVDLGKPDPQDDPMEFICESKENVRVAVGRGVESLVAAGATDVFVDDCGDAESAAEAANLVLFSYDELKDPASRKKKVPVKLWGEDRNSAWDLGVIKADAQQFAMSLMEAPANILTPRAFIDRVANRSKNLNIELEARSKSWAEEKKMGAFLSVARGSEEPPMFLEIHYRAGAETDPPVLLVGKGITFDSGGISLKGSKSMDKMRSDMGGGAVISSTILAAATLKLKLNIIGLVPLCENMPGGRATKPGDVVVAMNGKSIQIDNTDAEGRLILADALSYAQTFKPAFIIDVATLTGAIKIALGSTASGAFTNAPEVLELLRKASYETGDRIWPMPVFKYFTKVMKDASKMADLNNIQCGGPDGSSCTAAAFLKEFVGDCKWIHIDMAGVMEHNGELPYLAKGMSGRPTRTLIEFLKMYVQGK